MRVLAVTARDNRGKVFKIAAFGMGAALLASGPAWVKCQRNTSLVAELAPGMHGIGFVVACACAAIAVVTFGALLYSIATAQRSGSVRRHGPLVEILWALIPILIVIGAVAPSIRALATHSANPSVTYKCEMSGNS